MDNNNIICSLFIPFSVKMHIFRCRNSNMFDQDGVLSQTRWTCYVIHGICTALPS